MAGLVACIHVQYLADMADHALSSALKEAMKSEGLTQNALAVKAGVDPSLISRYLSGEVSQPTPDVLEKLGAVLSTDLTGLTNAEDDVHDVFVASPINGLSSTARVAHLSEISQIVADISSQLGSVYWPGDMFRSEDGSFPRAVPAFAEDLFYSRNVDALRRAKSFLYLQFAPVKGPSSASVELGLAIGWKKPTVAIVQEDFDAPNILKGLQGVTATRNHMQQAHVYDVATKEYAVDLLRNDGRHLLQLDS